MTIKKKTMGAFAVIILISVISSILVSYNNQKVKSNVDELSNVGFKGITFLLEADRDSYQSNVSLLQIMQMPSGENLEKTITKGAQDNLLQVKQRFTKFKNILAEHMPKEKAKFASFDTFYDATNKATEEMIALVRAGNASQATTIYFDTYLQSYESMRDLIDYFTEATYKVIDKNKEATDALISQSQTIFVIITLLTIGVSIILSFLLGKMLNKSLGNFQVGLLNFFKYINGEIKEVNQLNESGKDEISEMALVINKNIIKTQKSLESDRKLIEEVKQVVEKVSQGKFKQQVKATTENKGLEDLKHIFNEMLAVISKKVCDDIAKIEAAYKAYENLNFAYKIPKDSGYIPDILNDLAKIISDILVENKSNGLTLEESSNQLLKNVEELNNSTNDAASSLEETAAALEEINSNIQSNMGNVAQMVKYANELTHSSNEGETMAKNTTRAMDDINEQVTLINESITVIDQIAFQTNILSLNAAVEAATAGEAGKGFAVVAQEVRNLAARSAEAAKEIKEIVENATIKANDGKTISDQMITGYSKLNTNVQETMSLIQQVESATKEQQAGIAQISDAVNQLDHQTQSNAAIANGTRDIATYTHSIAVDILDNANKKNFEGKESVLPKDKINE
ncbi:HAMP domain-containing methyl-accepting chemotaxis protein [Candidatus Marinarcus aquaticus]|uniref:Methyl-accepting chemotaxis protein n=1 Tax=Candidatus Marinarcus aquaticus TaxID=2044504 RepID=A0A4Q0XNW3_9BACT|nr:methyl-accepting chemotaxis protein [Candidatus Marinarcus aquaticus]RXJ56280.1 methyl-accepting chemotaxis protein [Candidatus Marinarcus aquaticus]